MNCFKLTKIAIDEGCTSAVPVGFEARGYALFIPPSEFPIVSLDNLTEDVKGVYVDGTSTWIKTSPISEIISREDNKVVFKTTTSTYRIEEIR